MSNKWSDKIIESEQFKDMDTLDKLARLFVDQQSEYWYDPCGKSGNSYETFLTDNSKKVLYKMFMMVEYPEKLVYKGHKVAGYKT